jgi:zinc finger FYVE domain-containing protein 26
MCSKSLSLSLPLSQKNKIPGRSQFHSYKLQRSSFSVKKSMSFLVRLFGGNCCDANNDATIVTPSSRSRRRRQSSTSNRGPRKRISGAYEKAEFKKSSAGKCELCQRDFTLTVRQHHCRRCGRVVCFACSECKDFFHGERHKKRICNTCVDSSQQDLIQDWSLGMFSLLSLFSLSLSLSLSLLC